MRYIFYFISYLQSHFGRKLGLSICTVHASVFVELVSKLLFLPLDYLSSKLSAHQIIVSDKVRFDLVRKFPITDNSLCLEHCYLAICLRCIDANDHQQHKENSFLSYYDRWPISNSIHNDSSNINE